MSEERRCPTCSKAIVRKRLACGRLEQISSFEGRSYCSRECARTRVTKNVNIAGERALLAREKRKERRASGGLPLKALKEIKWTPFVVDRPDFDRCWCGYKEGRRCVRERGHYRDPGQGASPHMDSNGRKWFGSSPSEAEHAAEDFVPARRYVADRIAETKIPGVTRVGSRWRAYIRIDGEQKTIGRFTSAQEAAAALVAWKSQVAAS